MMPADFPPSSSETRDPLAAQAHDATSGRGAAGEGDLVHARVSHQVFTGFAPGGEHADHPFRKPGRFQRLGEQQRAQRAFRGGFQHHRAAGRERRADLERGGCDGTVPRDDAGDHADRFVHQLAPPAVPVPILLEAETGVQCGHVVPHLQRVVVESAAHRERRADLGGEGGDHVVVAGGDLAPHPRQRLAALGRRHPRPRPVIERRACRGHRSVHIGLGDFRNRGQHFLGAGRDDFQPAGAAGFDPPATDEHLRVALQRGTAERGAAAHPGLLSHHRATASAGARDPR